MKMCCFALDMTVFPTLKQGFGPAHDILLLTTMSSSEGSDESAHMHSLARDFASCIHKV